MPQYGTQHMPEGRHGDQVQTLLRLEEEKNRKDVDLTEEQIKLLEKANPCFRERHVESPYPGYLLSQDTFMVGTLKGIGRIYLPTSCSGHLRFLCLWQALHLKAS